MTTGDVVLYGLPVIERVTSSHFSGKNHTARPKLVALLAAHLLPPSASNCWGPQKWRFIGCVILHVTHFGGIKFDANVWSF